MGINIEMFNQPTKDWRGKPFFALNGKLKIEEMLRQINIFKEMGFGGFFLHSRTGLDTEYLGDEWFELMNTCADEAMKIGLEAWLYDEDRWPSGTAGGMVTENEQYRMKFIRCEILDKKCFDYDKEYIALFKAKVEGLNFYDASLCTIDEMDSIIEEMDIIAFYIETMNPSSFYNGSTYVDTMNIEATKKFIELTHEKYKDKCGDRLGKSIKGIFTDEPHRGQLMNGFAVSNPKAEWMAPYTGKLFEVFEETFGYDLLQKLPELFLRKDGELVSQVKWHYVEILQRLFLENWAKPLQQWCKENDLILTGHILHEDNLTAQVAMCGSVMRYYEHMDYPGIDVLGRNNNNYWIAKQLQSAARQLGKKWLLSEYYGVSGWDLSFEEHKRIGDWQSLQGINIRCPHLAMYTMEGEAKRDYPASIGYQSGWYKEYRYVEDYFSRLNYLISQGEREADVLVINPVETVWSMIYPGWSKNIGINSDEVNIYEEAYAKTYHYLMERQIDFDYGDEAMMLEIASVNISDGQPVLTIGEAHYKVVIIPKMKIIRSTTLEILKEFIEAGGKVITIDSIPEYVDALYSNDAETILNNCVNTQLESEELAQIIHDYLLTSVMIANQNIFTRVNRLDDSKMFFLLNTNKEEAYKNVEVKLIGEGYLTLWDCLTGERFAISKIYSKEYTKLNIDFEPGEFKVLQLSTLQEQLPMHDVKMPIKQINVKDEFRYKLSEPNVCVLDMATYRFGELVFDNKTEILKIDRAIRNNFGVDYRGGEMYQPWFMKKVEDPVLSEVVLDFEFNIQEKLDGDISLGMESKGLFNVYLNDFEITEPQDNWWVDRDIKIYKLPKEKMLLGKNRITLTTQFKASTNLESIYLLGDFSVSFDKGTSILKRLPQKVSIGDLTKKGFPFYSGKFTYLVEIPNDVKTANSAFISVEEFNGACILIKSHNTEKIIPWHPYKVEITDEIKEQSHIELEVVLTRRNSFGPLHFTGNEKCGIGPMQFITDIEEFSSEYQLIPSGLLKGVKFLI